MYYNAKRYIPLNKFDGGLVTNTDPIDATGSECLKLLNLEITKRGALKVRDPFELKGTIINKNIVALINWVDITNSDENLWLVIFDDYSHVLYNDAWSATTAFHTSIAFNPTSAEWDLYTDGNIVRIAYSSTKYPRIIQHIKDRNFFYGLYSNWTQGSPENDSGYYGDYARPTAHDDYPFTPAIVVTLGGTRRVMNGNLTLGKRYSFKYINFTVS